MARINAVDNNQWEVYFTSFYKENEQPPTNMTLRNGNQEHVNITENNIHNRRKFLKNKKTSWQRWNNKRNIEVRRKKPRIIAKTIQHYATKCKGVIEMVTE